MRIPQTWQDTPSENPIQIRTPFRGFVLIVEGNVRTNEKVLFCYISKFQEMSLLL
jgi:hypothetical protein